MTSLVAPKIPPRIVTIGGGSGQYAVLQSLLPLTPNPTAIACMVDDGGSTGRLRRELGVRPAGDLRQCLLALAGKDTHPHLHALMNYRFHGGSLDGHNFGNLLLAAYEKVTNNFVEAVQSIGHLMHIHGQVLPVTLDDQVLVAELEDGTMIEGQRPIEEKTMDEHLFIKTLKLKSAVSLYKPAREAILAADLVLISPGSIVSSILPNFLVTGMVEALQTTRARIIAVCNFFAKPGQFRIQSAGDLLDLYASFLGENIIDVAFVNTGTFTPEVLEVSKKRGDTLLAPTARQTNIQVIAENFVGENIVTSPQDYTLRSLVRHDAQTLTSAIRSLLAA
jgi:uncharacterized cofD-like protein